MEKGKQYYLSYNIEAVRKNIKWGRENGGPTIWERKLRFKKKCGCRRISNCRELFTSLNLLLTFYVCL